MSDVYISRQEAINAFYTQLDDEGWWTGTVQDVEELLNSLQSTQSKPKTGHWVKDDFTGLIKCDACGNDAYMDTTSHEQCESYFCPNCGAKMEVSE